MANSLHQLMPNFARHAGRWIGTYTHLTPSGEATDSYEVRTFAELPDDGSADFRLHVQNVWPDGRESEASFEAHYRDGRLRFDGVIVGALWEIDDFTVYFRFGYRDDPAVEVCEMFQITEDGRHRARTWHWFRDRQLFRITLTEERRPD